MNNEFDTSKQSIKSSVSAAVDQGAEAVQAVKAKLGDVNESASELYDRTTTYIQAHPLKAIGIAYGAGYLAMRIKTSPLFKIGLLGALLYAGSQFVRRNAASGSVRGGGGGMASGMIRGSSDRGVGGVGGI